MAKTTEEIEEIRARMRANPKTAGLADHLLDPNSEKYREFQRKGNETKKRKAAERKEKEARIQAKAEEMAINIGCSGYHTHEFENKTWYMPCEKHINK